MGFDIRFISRTTGKRPIPGEVTGQITLGGFSERFITDVSYWRPLNYQMQWREAVQRLVSGADKAALITSAGDPTTAHGLDWWPMYRVGGVVYVQNAVLVLDPSSGYLPFDNPYAFLLNREYGEDVSEWEVSTVDLEQFLARK